jgi:oligopeptide transport system permease protein
MLITLWVIATATFVMMKALPGDPLRSEKVPPEVRKQILEQYGLNDPIPVQYLKYLGNIVQGDFGKSLTFDGRSVTEMLLDGFQASAFIGLQGLAFGVIIGLLLGVISALRRGTWVDNASAVTAVLGYSVPNFVLGALLSYYVGVVWGILPPGLWESYESTILPSLALSFPVMSQISLYTRTEMVEVLDQDYMKTAKAKGLERSTIIFRHALRNALIPAITILGPLAINILTGSLVIEKIFAVPGMGELFVNSIVNNDYTLIMGVALFYSVLIVTMIFVVDLLYGVIDPRIRISGAKE